MDLLGEVRGPRHYARVLRREEDATLVSKVARAPLQLVSRDLSDLVQDFARRLVDGRAADRHRARVEGAGPEGNGLRVALDDLDGLGRDPEHVSRDLGEARGMALPGALRAGEHGRAPVGVYDHARAFVASAPESDWTHSNRRRSARALREGREAVWEVDALQKWANPRRAGGEGQ